MNFSHVEHHQALIRVFTAVVGVAVGIGVILFITSSPANIIAVAAMIGGAGLCVTCVVSPRNGVYLLVALSLYLDLLKRLLLLSGDIDFSDIGRVLAIAPLMTVGLVLAIITRQAFHRLELTRADLAFFVIGGLIMSLTFAIGVRDNGVGLEAAKFAINSSCYVFLVPVITRTFATAEDVNRLLRFSTFVGIPVAIYGIWQQLFGISDFEYAYLRTGLTVTAELLNDFKVRPFSTLNSPTALSAVTGTLAVLALIPLLNRRANAGGIFAPSALFVLYVAACVASVSRAGNMIWILGTLGAWAFQKRGRIRAFYLLALASFATLVTCAKYIQDHLAEWDPAQYATSVFTTQATGIQTYSERLQGFANLTSSTAMYSLFGLTPEELISPETYNHDAFSYIITHFGIIPTTILLITLFLGARLAHRRIFSMPANFNRRIATVAVSLILAILATSVLFGGAYSTVFPQNLLLWTLVAVAVVVLTGSFDPAPVAAMSGSDDEEKLAGLWRPERVPMPPERGRRPEAVSRRERPGFR